MAICHENAEKAALKRLTEVPVALAVKKPSGVARAGTENDDADRFSVGRRGFTDEGESGFVPAIGGRRDEEVAIGGLRRVRCPV